MKTIHEFSKGDAIVRIRPAKPYYNGLSDRSYLGEGLIFLGIANNRIYCERISNKLNSEPISLSMDLWSDGWDYYEYPKALYDLSNIIKNKISNNGILKSYIFVDEDGNIRFSVISDNNHDSISEKIKQGLKEDLASDDIVLMNEFIYDDNGEIEFTSSEDGEVFTRKYSYVGVINY